MELVHISKKDILEIYKDEDKYILKYPTFNITMPEVVKEVSKEAVDSYLAGEHTGEELITYANYGFWKPKNHLTQEESNRNFLRNHPQLIFKNIENNRRLFSKEEFEELLAKAHELSKPKVLLEVTTIDSLGIVDGYLELLLADGNEWLPDTE